MEIYIQSIFPQKVIQGIHINPHTIENFDNINSDMKESKIKSQRIELNRFNYCSQPIPNFRIPSQIFITSLQVSDRGQTGVIFIELPEGSFVIKATSHAPTHLFYNKLAILLDVQVANMFCFTFEDQLHCKLMAAMQQYCGEHDECLLARLVSRFNNYFYEVLEYVPSIILAHFGHEKYTKWMITEKKLQSMGRCIGYDMLINNNDRFNLIWGGDGNIDNILIEIPNSSLYKIEELHNRQNSNIELGNYIFIDNQGNMCDIRNKSIAENISKYFEKVVNFQKSMLSFLQSQRESNESSAFMKSNQTQRLISQINMFTKYELQEMQIREIMVGVRETTEKFMRLFQLGKIKQLQQQLQDEPCLKKMGKFCSEQWKLETSKIYLSYCQKYYEKLKALY